MSGTDFGKMGEVVDPSSMVSGVAEGASEALGCYKSFLRETMEDITSKSPNDQDGCFFKIISFGITAAIASIKTLDSGIKEDWAKEHTIFVATNLGVAMAVKSGLMEEQDLEALAPFVAFLSPSMVRSILDPEKASEEAERASEEEKITNLPDGFMDGLAEYLGQKDAEGVGRAIGNIFRGRSN